MLGVTKRKLANARCPEAIRIEKRLLGIFLNLIGIIICLCSNVTLPATLVCNAVYNAKHRA